MGSGSLRCYFSGKQLIRFALNRYLFRFNKRGFKIKSFEFFQDNGLVPIVEPEILLDGEHGIDRTFEVAKQVWAEVFFYLAQNNVLFEGILLKPSMVTPGADCKERATPQQVADYTLKLLQKRIPPAVPGIMASLLTTFSLDHRLCAQMIRHVLLDHFIISSSQWRSHLRARRGIGPSSHFKNKN